MRTFAISCLLVAGLPAGCAAPLAPSLLSSSRRQEAQATAIDEQSARDDGPKSAAVRKATAEPLTHEQALAGILDELQEIRAIDPEAERELMADLREAKPEHYPMIIQAFRTALAYRRQLAERRLHAAEQEGLAQAPTSLEPWASRPPTSRDQRLANQAPETKALEPAEAASAADRGFVQSAAHEPPPDPPPATVEPIALRPAPAARALSPVEGAPPAANVETAIAADSRDASATQVSYTPSASGDWRSQLDAAVASLEHSVRPQPASVDELHDHMRLRTLQLLAGREEEAYRPLPGASPAQQDYWSKQLFAIAAYLNSAAKLDDKQRAAAALAALDEARAKLSELATLQIRNAAFVARVDGYGAYEPRKPGDFQPGQKVTLYAEVENFTSSAAEDGYHTSLGTSYQVLDGNRRRVDAKQFPDVADTCRNRRRDFHMQYEFALPLRIYPGEYELELTITDHHSGKIGQATLPFQIAGER